MPSLHCIQLALLLIIYSVKVTEDTIVINTVETRMSICTVNKAHKMSSEKKCWGEGVPFCR
jgi:hypothetical protein